MPEMELLLSRMNVDGPATLLWRGGESFRPERTRSAEVHGRVPLIGKEVASAAIARDVASLPHGSVVVADCEFDASAGLVARRVITSRAPPPSLPLAEILRVLLHDKDFGPAVELATERDDEVRRDAAAWGLRAQAYVKLGRLDAAIEDTLSLLGSSLEARSPAAKEAWSAIPPPWPEGLSRAVLDFCAEHFADDLASVPRRLIPIALWPLPVVLFELEEVVRDKDLDRAAARAQSLLSLAVDLSREAATPSVDKLLRKLASKVDKLVRTAESKAEKAAAWSAELWPEGPPRVLTVEEIGQRWRSGPLVRFEREHLAELGLPEQTERLLLEVGLPKRHRDVKFYPPRNKEPLPRCGDLDPEDPNQDLDPLLGLFVCGVVVSEIAPDLCIDAAGVVHVVVEGDPSPLAGSLAAMMTIFLARQAFEATAKSVYGRHAPGAALRVSYDEAVAKIDPTAVADYALAAWLDDASG